MSFVHHVTSSPCYFVPSAYYKALFTRVVTAITVAGFAVITLRTRKFVGITWVGRITHALRRETFTMNWATCTQDMDTVMINTFVKEKLVSDTIPRVDVAVYCGDKVVNFKS